MIRDSDLESMGKEEIVVKTAALHSERSEKNHEGSQSG
jgi:hypothetical protein